MLPRTYDLSLAARPRRAVVLFALLAGLGALAAAGPSCTPAPVMGAGGAGDCLNSPYFCQGNETCWPNDAVTKFVCIMTPQGKKIGDPCDFIGGQVVCPPSSICIVQGTNQGVCTPYCDASHTCPSMAACEGYTIKGPTGQVFTAHACDAVTIAKSGASGSAASSSSSASSSGSTSSASGG